MDKTIILQNILKLYNNKQYTEIFEYVYENYKFFIIIINELQKLYNLEESSSKKIGYFISTNIEQLYNLFLKQNNELYFILTFKHIILESINKTCSHIVYGKDEFVISDNKYPKDIVYRIIITDTELGIKTFASYILLYTVDSIFSSKLIIGIDYEFNNRQIALMQINFECNHTHENNSYIFIVDPTEFDNELLDFFIITILENQKVLKVMHGADPLDIPYTFADLLNGDVQSILNFNNTLIDTRFLCEYARLLKNEKPKCAIYVALHHFKTISDDKFNLLTSIDLGPIENITWNIGELNDAQKKYGMYDVLFLKKFYYDIIEFAKKNDDERVFKYYLVEFSRLSYLEKRKITNMLEKIELVTNRMNLNVIRKRNKISGDIKEINLQTIYDKVIADLVIDNPTVQVSKMANINYLRKPILIICKYTIYSIITHNFPIYTPKHELMTHKLYISVITEYLEKYKFSNLDKFTKYVSIKAHDLIMNYAKYA